jgi:hypothetical protein
MKSVPPTGTETRFDVARGRENAAVRRWQGIFNFSSPNVKAKKFCRTSNQEMFRCVYSVA